MRNSEASHVITKVGSRIARHAVAEQARDDIEPLPPWAGVRLVSDRHALQQIEERAGPIQAFFGGSIFLYLPLLFAAGALVLAVRALVARAGATARVPALAACGAYAALHPGFRKNSVPVPAQARKGRTSSAPSRRCQRRARLTRAPPPRRSTR